MSDKGWLVIPDKPLPLDQCALLVRQVAKTWKRWPMIVGEVASKIEDWHGEASSQLLDEFGYKHPNVLSNYKFVYRRCRENYTDALPFTYWQALAAIADPAKQCDLVTQCMAEQWTRADLRRAIADVLGDNPTADGKIVPGGSMAPQTALMERIDMVADRARPFLKALKRLQEEDGAAARTALLMAGDDLFAEWTRLSGAIR